MPSICSAPPQPGAACGTPPPQLGLSQAVTALQHFIRSRFPSAESTPGSVIGSRETKRVATAQKYMAARLAGRNEEVLRLVSEDVELESSRDGHFQGKAALGQYLGRVKPTGSWTKARWNGRMGRAEVLGNVKILMVNVGVIARFGFDRGGKINRIYVGRMRRGD